VRESADLTFEHGEELSAMPTASTPNPSSCRALASADIPVTPGSALALIAPPGQRGSIYLRRLGSAYPSAPFATVSGPARQMLRFPLDRAQELPWHVRVVAAHPLTICVS
jgi:hypothetical protein